MDWTQMDAIQVSWDEHGSLHIAHDRDEDGSPCIATVPGAERHVVQHDPLTLRTPVRCTRCGHYGRIIEGRWI